MPIHGSRGRLDGSAAARGALGAGRSYRRARHAGFLGASRAFPDLVDLVDQVKELLGVVQVNRCLEPCETAAFRASFSWGNLASCFSGLYQSLQRTSRWCLASSARSSLMMTARWR